MITDILQIPVPSLRAVLFDLDGVIVDSEPLHFKSWQEALRPHRSSVLTWKEFLKQIYGRADTEVLKSFFPIKNSLQNRKTLEVKNRFFCNHLNEIPVLQPILSFLKSQKKYQTGLVSNALAVEVEQLLTFLKIHQSFSVIVTADRVVHPKPDPEPYETAFKQLCTTYPLHMDQVLVIEDSELGARSAESAGFPWVLQREFAHPDVVKIIKLL